MCENIDMNFENEEDLDSGLSELLNIIGEKILEEERKTTMLNPIRFQQFKFSYNVLKLLTKNKKVSLTYKLYEPFKTMGSISIEGDVLEFDRPEWFAKVAGFASNTEIYPLSKNAVRMTFTFHGMTNPIE